MQGLELLDLLLEDPDVVHEGDHPVRGHGGGVETGGCEEGGDVQRHVALGGVKDEQLGPDEPQEPDLVSDGELGEAGDAPGPLYAGEQELGRELADGLDVAHFLGDLHPEPGGVRLGADEHGDVGAEVTHGGAQGVCTARKPVSHEALVRRYSAWLHGLLPHPHLEALLESAVLALVPVVLVNRTAFVAATLIGEVPPD